MNIPPAVSIGITLLKDRATGHTIEERFRSLLKPAVLDEACWMTTDDDQRFRAAVGALMLSYGAGTPEFARIETEMKQIQGVSLAIQAATLGSELTLPEVPEDFTPIGLLGIWHERERR